MSENNEMGATGSNDTSEKPKEEPKYGKFFAKFGVYTASIIGFVVCGTIGLYMTKVAMSGILPTEYDPTDAVKSDIPYACHKPNTNIKPSSSNTVEMNTIREYGMKGLAWLFRRDPIVAYSQQATFDQASFDKSFNGGTIKKQVVEADPNKPPSNYKGPPGQWTPSNFTKWSSKATNNCVSFSFYFIQTVFGWFGNWNETLAITILGWNIIPLLIPVLMTINIFWGFWLHIDSLKGTFPLTTGMDFLNTQTRAETEPNRDDLYWQSEINNRWYNGLSSFFGGITIEDYKNETPWLQYLKFGFLWFMVTLALIPYFILRAIFISPIITTFYSLYKTIFDTSYKLKKAHNFSGKDNDENNYTGPKGIGSFIMDTFIYKKTYLIFLSIVNLFIQTNDYLGVNYFGAVFIAVIMAIWFGDIFVSTIPTDDNTLIQKPLVNEDDSNDKEKELDEDVDNDECDDASAKMGELRDRIRVASDKLSNTQLDALQLLSGIKYYMDDRKDKNTQLESITVPEFSDLRMNANELITAYMNCVALNSKTTLLPSDSEPMIQRKLVNQLRDMTMYTEQLVNVTDECTKAFTNFMDTNPEFSNVTKENLSKNINDNTWVDSQIGGSKLLTLMDKISDAEHLCFNTRPTTILDWKNKNEKDVKDGSLPLPLTDAVQNLETSIKTINKTMLKVSPGPINDMFKDWFMDKDGANQTKMDDWVQELDDNKHNVEVAAKAAAEEAAKAAKAAQAAAEEAKKQKAIAEAAKAAKAAEKQNAGTTVNQTPTTGTTAPVVPVDQSGAPVVPVDQSGAPVVPVDQSGAPVVPTTVPTTVPTVVPTVDQSGAPSVPTTDQSGATTVPTQKAGSKKPQRTINIRLV
jgi:hypothetical protein